MHRDPGLKAYLAGAVFSLLVGFSFLGTKICVRYADAWMIMTYRFDFAMAALVIVCLFRKKWFSFGGRPIKSIMIAGLSYSLFLLIQAMGLYYATSVEAAILFAAGPAFVEIIAMVFLKEKTNIRQSACVLIVIAALIFMIVMSSGKISFDIRATLLLLISVLMSAVYTVAVRACMGEYSSLDIGSVSTITGFAVFNMISLFQCIRGGGVHVYLQPAENYGFLIAAAYLGICCILASTMLTGYMGKYLQSTVMSVFGNVSSAISILAGALILGEPVYSYYIFCTAVIIAGVIGTAYWAQSGETR
jgi:drug/metabolite transporter (DMT)-like permease